jgi:hypothetical protein
VEQSDAFELPDAPVVNKQSEAFKDLGNIEFEPKLDRRVPEESTGLVSLREFSFTNNIDAKLAKKDKSVPKEGSEFFAYQAQVTVKVTDPIETETKHSLLVSIVNPDEKVSKDAPAGVEKLPETVWIDALPG